MKRNLKKTVKKQYFGSYFVVVLFSIAVIYLGGLFLYDRIQQVPRPDQNPQTIVPTESETPTSVLPTSKSPTPTPTVTIPKGTKKFTISSENIPLTHEFYIKLPNGITATSDAHTITLKKGADTIMLLNMDFAPVPESPVTYSSVVKIDSDNFPGLNRFRSKSNLGRGFYIGYSTYVWAKSECESESQVGPVPAPCITDGVRSPDFEDLPVMFKARCSVISTYTDICDQVMKTLFVVDVSPEW